MSLREQCNAPNVSDDQFTMAEALLTLMPSPDFLQVKTTLHKSDNLPLQHQVLKSKNNINAVGVRPECVAFMVTDWSFEEEAKQLGFETERDPKNKLRLQFLGLVVDDVRSNPAFFLKLIETARSRSHYLQTNGQKHG
jgi:hypothetical protein